MSQRLSHASVRKLSHIIVCVDLDICGLLIKRVLYLATGLNSLLFIRITQLTAAIILDIWTAKAVSNSDWEETTLLKLNC